MNARLVLLASLALLMASKVACAQPITCPAYAPATAQAPPARLDSVRVLSYPKDDPPADDGTSRAMAPSTEREAAGFLYQSWLVGFDAPAYVFRVDCVYKGSGRYLSFDVSSAKHCTAKWRLRRGAVQDGSLQFRCD